MDKLLFVSATPKGQLALRTGNELKALRTTVTGHLEVVELHAATVGDLLHAILDEAPKVVHFAGHGDEGRLYFEDEAGKEQVAFAPGLARMLEQVPLVVLNACRGTTVTAHMQRTTTAAVASPHPIVDAHARYTASTLYKMLIAGRTLEAAVRAVNVYLHTVENGPPDTFEIVGDRQFRLAAAPAPATTPPPAIAVPAPTPTHLALTLEDVEALVDVAIKHSVTREMLLAPLPADLRYDILRHGGPASHLHTDLTMLNAMDTPLVEGRPPVVAWIRSLRFMVKIFPNSHAKVETILKRIAPDLS